MAGPRPVAGTWSTVSHSCYEELTATVLACVCGGQVGNICAYAGNQHTTLMVAVHVVVTLILPVTRVAGRARGDLIAHMRNLRYIIMRVCLKQ